MTSAVCVTFGSGGKEINILSFFIYLFFLSCVNVFKCLETTGGVASPPTARQMNAASARSPLEERETPWGIADLEER